jgi:hypothetical protein
MDPSAAFVKTEKMHMVTTAPLNVLAKGKIKTKVPWHTSSIVVRYNRPLNPNIRLILSLQNPPRPLANKFMLP